MRRAGVVLTVLGTAVLASPAVAAGVVGVSLQGGTLTITGSADDESISLGSAGSNALGPTTRVSGGGADMQAGPGCQGFGDPNGPANDNSVFCPTNGIARLHADLQGGDDEIATEGLESTVLGGPGADEIVIGRAGSDGRNTVDAGPGDDTVEAGRADQADDITGGEGVDTVSYASHAATAVSLDGVANDGVANEGDNVRPDVEKVIGTSAGDVLIGSDGPDTLDGAGGTDRLEGLGGPDTLIGGPGSGDATFGGPGEDALMLRDGLADACPDGGPDTDTFDLDLVDQAIIFGRIALPRCLFTVVPGLRARTELLVIGAVDEGPNVRMGVSPPAVREAGVRVRLVCPAALRSPCAGSLRVFTARGARALGRVVYSIRPGAARVLTVPLGAAARAAALGASALRIVSVEKGRSPLGPKTTILIVPPRAS